MPFLQLGLPSPLVRNVCALGYKTPTPIQAQAIPAIQSGRDVIATAQTGTGKTAAFLLPVLQQLLDWPRGATGALVLTPTRELAQQIDSVFRGLAVGLGLRSTLVIGGTPELPQARALRAGSELVVATPGRLLAHLQAGAFRPAQLRALILDEADQMFDMGFLPDLKRIIARLPVQRQTLLFSATMPPEVAQISQKFLRDPLTVAAGQQGVAASSVTHAAYPVPMHRKTALLRQLLEQLEMPSVLVFTRTRRGAQRLAKALAEDHHVGELHSDRSPAQRARVMHGFRTGKFPVLVATNIAARGLDVSHITHVINFDVPDAPDEYVHRIGRTGRAGKEGEALVFVAPEEKPRLTRIERRLGQPLPRRHLDDFDYQAAAPASASKKGGQRRPPEMGTPRRKKPSRGQGRR